MSKKNIRTYLNPDTLPFPFCPGCGHSIILNRLNEALVDLQLDPHKTVIVSDIGCSGLSDKFFDTNAMHGLHGRSLTYATGIKLMNPELHVVVIIGDGGCGIGGHHLLNAARRNIGIKVLVFNNFNYGMTGGEHSVTTPQDAITATTPHGHLEKPLDICATVGVNGANYVRRTTTFDKKLAEHIKEALTTKGFALMDIWELCTSYFAPRNKFSRRDMENTLTALQFETGLLTQEDRPEYSGAIRELSQKHQPPGRTQPMELAADFGNSLPQRKELVLAGDAGTKIGSAARIFCQAVVMADAYATQRHDYPVTVRSGHSISEIVLSPKPIYHPGVDHPAWVIALFPAGLNKVRSTIKHLPESSTLYIDTTLPDIKTSARIIRLDFSSLTESKIKKEEHALAALTTLVLREGLFDFLALKKAAGLRKAFVKLNQRALKAGRELLEHI